MELERKPPCQELTRFVQLFGYNSVLVTDKRSDRHRQDDIKYRANIALRGKNYWVKNRPVSYLADSDNGSVYGRVLRVCTCDCDVDR